MSMAMDAPAPPDISNGHGPRGSNEARGEARGNPFKADPARGDHELTQIRMPVGLVRRFNAWYEGQVPDARQRKSKDNYYLLAFELGLKQLEERVKPVKSLDDRIAEALGEKKQ